MIRLTRHWSLGLALLAACSQSPKLLDFKFSPADGDKTYRSTTIEQAIREELRDESQPSLIVVVTSSVEDPKFREQFQIMKKLPADELETLFVMACPTGCAGESYAMSAESARKLFGDNPKFRVFVLDGKGRVIKDSKDVLKAKEIREIVEKRWTEGS